MFPKANRPGRKKPLGSLFIFLMIRLFPAISAVCSRALLLRCLLAVMTYLIIPTNSRAEMRTWSSTSGHTVRAELAEVKPGDEVVLRYENGNTKSLSLTKLSAADQTYVRNSPLAKMAKTARGTPKIPLGDQSMQALDEVELLVALKRPIGKTWDSAAHRCGRLFAIDLSHAGVFGS